MERKKLFLGGGVCWIMGRGRGYLMRSTWHFLQKCRGGVSVKLYGNFIHEEMRETSCISGGASAKHLHWTLKMGKKKGIDEYLRRNPGESIHTIRHFLRTLHQDWNSGLCCGKEKTWRRLKLARPSLARFITRDQIFQLLDGGDGLGCGVLFSASVRLSAEQVQLASQGQHILATTCADLGALRTSMR